MTFCKAQVLFSAVHFCIDSVHELHILEGPAVCQALGKLHVENRRELDNHCAVLNPTGPALSRHMTPDVFRNSIPTAML